MKTRCLFLQVLITLIVLPAISCNTNSNTSPVTDSTQGNSVADSMPVLETPLTDSSAILTTPPVNDKNVINPDSNRGSR